MVGVIILAVMAAIFGTLAAAALRWGVDSRKRSIDGRTTPGVGLR